MPEQIQEVDVIRTIPPVEDVRAAIASCAKRRRILGRLLDLALKAQELTNQEEN